MVGVLCIALVLGLIGFAVHVLWIVAIIVMALGLGFAVANRRQDRIDVVNRRADAGDKSDAA
jgi:Flp pilus assembly protein TadB